VGDDEAGEDHIQQEALKEFGIEAFRAGPGDGHPPPDEHGHGDDRPNAWTVTGPNRWYSGCGKYGIMKCIVFERARRMPAASRSLPCGSGRFRFDRLEFPQSRLQRLPAVVRLLDPGLHRFQAGPALRDACPVLAVERRIGHGALQIVQLRLEVRDSRFRFPDPLREP